VSALDLVTFAILKARLDPDLIACVDKPGTIIVQRIA
jgi:hypothetical protein